MKINIVCVNYNSYSKLYKYLKSIEDALVNVPDVEVSIYIADNSTRKENFTYYGKLNCTVYDFDNKGYFGGALDIINKLDSVCIDDYTIISNVDITIGEDFFKELCSLNVSENCGWLAPQIYSFQECRDKNPQRIKRCTKQKIKQLIFLFKHPILQRFYKKTFYKRKHADKSFEPGIEIYCGHGSFIMLTKRFFQNYATLSYPCFLYCEELFLGELVRNVDLKVYYYPQLKVLDEEHVSTSQLPSKAYYSYNLESLKFILNNFYKD